MTVNERIKFTQDIRNPISVMEDVKMTEPDSLADKRERT